MFYSDFLRQLLLGATAAIFLFFVVWAVVHRASLAKALGYQLTSPNGESEFGAIYIGLFLAQTLLCIFAMTRVQDAAVGDLAAGFLLLQPLGRVLPFIRHGPPTGLLRILFILEIFGGLALLLVRPNIRALL